jgi:hypothetical protein
MVFAILPVVHTRTTTREVVMKSVTHLFGSPSATRRPALALRRFQNGLRTAIDVIKVWRRRAREREELRRYCIKELRGLPSDLADAARIECEKPFWEA